MYLNILSRLYKAIVRLKEERGIDLFRKFFFRDSVDFIAYKHRGVSKN